MKEKYQNLVFIGLIYVLFTSATDLSNFNQEDVLSNTCAENEFTNINLKKNK